MVILLSLKVKQLYETGPREGENDICLRNLRLSKEPENLRNKNLTYERAIKRYGFIYMPTWLL